MRAKKVNKFKMKGHSIPGIKGFKGTSKEDGRAASSAFQIKTPLLEETRTTLDANTEVILPDVVDRSFSTAQKFGESYKAAGGKQRKRKMKRGKDLVLMTNMQKRRKAMVMKVSV